MINRNIFLQKNLNRAFIFFIAYILLLIHCGVLCADSLRPLYDQLSDQTGNWTTMNNEIIASGDGAMTITSDNWKDYTLKLKLITDKSGSNAWDTAAVRFRAKDDNNYYYAIIHQTGTLEFGKVMNGDKVANLATSDTTANVTKWNEFQITLKGSLTVISLNGKETIRFTDPKPLTSGGVTLWSLGAMKCRFKDISASTSSGNIIWSKAGSTTYQKVMRRNAVGVFMGTSPADNVTAKDVMKNLAAAGFATIGITPEDAGIKEKITPQRFFLYVVPNSKRYPATGLKVVQDYLRSKGNLMVLGGPAFSEPVNKMKVGEAADKWYNIEEYKKKVSEVEGTTDPATYIKTLSQGGLKWTMLDVGKGDWSVSELETAGLKLVPGADDGITKNCLAYSADRIGGWGTFDHSIPRGLIKSEHDSLALWAKGDANTTQFLIELREEDSSRWLYPLSVSSEWQYYEIPFKSFKYWTSNKSRGGEGDSFKGTNGSIISIGMAVGNCKVTPGAHHFRIDGLGFTASSQTGFSTNVSKIDPIETIYPAYKTYPVGKTTSAVLDPRQCIITSAMLPSGGTLTASANDVSPIARPKGMGYGGESQCRWIPIVNAYDQNEKRGTIASLTINNSGRFKDVLCASIGVETPDENMSRILREIAVRMRDGLFLIEGGSEYSCYYQGESVKLGARVINLGEIDRNVTVQMKILAGTKVLWKSDSNLTLRKGVRESIEKRWDLRGAGSKPLIIKTTLIRDGKIIDSIQQGLTMLPPRGFKPPSDTFVTVSDGDFYLHGKKWYANGINFWPRYVNGMEDVYTWCSWFNSDFYQPDEVENDLDILNKMGVNMVSVQMILGKDYNGLTYPESSLRNVQDFLRRCANHSIKVNAYLMHTSPVCPVHSEYNPDFVASVLTRGDFANNNALFAYDLAWEASGWLYVTGRYKDWDKDWNNWIIERYGSIQSAEKDWGFQPEYTGDLAVSPTMAQLSKNPPASVGPEGNWLRYVAAYRRFADDFISRKFNDAVRHMKRFDPNHLFSVRGSGGTYSPVDFFLNGIAKHLDFISPEGYGISADEQGFNVLGFQSRLIHSLCNKPVYVAEYGMSVWDEGTGRSDPNIEKYQSLYYEDYFQSANEVGLNGLAPWWYPGGFRTGENSDYGVINPNGTLRPSAEMIKKYAGQFTSPREYPEANEWMLIDRDAYAGGYYDPAYHEGRDAYARSAASGKHLGIKTPGMGTDSANTPLTAVGNVPYNGSNPPKYLDGEFNWIKIKSGNGKWTDIFSNGTVVKVTPGEQITVRANMGNIGEATWLSPSIHPGNGGVYLSSRTDDITFSEPVLKDTPYLNDVQTGEFILSKGITKETTVVFELTALNRMWFGEKFKIVLMPE
ncbi:MAG: family 16 glycoside hydrolase [Armatimonadota bacterium]